MLKNYKLNVGLSEESFNSVKSKKSDKKNIQAKSNIILNKKENSNSINNQSASLNLNKEEEDKYDYIDSSEDITWENDVETKYSEIIELKKNEKNLANKNSEKKNNEYPENFIKDDDFRISNSLENIKFNHYEPNDKSSGSLFEGTIINYLYDIFNVITNGNLCFYRNQKYYHVDTDYELDFQISNLKIKDFLFFIGLIYPNIPTLEDLKMMDFKTIFSDEARIFDKIKDYQSGEICVDILGEITVDILNIEIKKQEQINKYINLVQLLEKNPDLNHKFNFSSKNKKIIVIITDGNIKKFFTLFNKKFKKRRKKKTKKQIESLSKDKSIDESKNTSEPLSKEKSKQSSNEQNKEIGEFSSLVDSNEQRKPNKKSELRAKKKLEDNIYLTLKAKNICHLFVYIKDKKNSKFAFNKKMNYKYSYLLEYNLNKPNQDRLEKDLDEIQLLKQLDFSNMHQNFYKDILFSKKLDILQNCIKKIDGRYMKSVQNLYINFLKTKTSKNYIYELFFKHFKFDSKSIKFVGNFAKTISEEFEKKATNTISKACIFELSDTGGYFDNYNGSVFGIDDYSSITNLSYISYAAEYKAIISNWLEKNKCNEYPKIFILHKIENNLVFFVILSFLIDEDSTEKFIFISKNNEKNLQLSSVYKKMFIYYFNDKDELLKKIPLFLSKEKLKKIICGKLLHRFSYFDKILKNSIITDDKANISDKYLDQFLIKISQITSIYCNNDISKYSDNLFDIDGLKKMIIEQNKYLKEFEGYFFEKIKSHLKINELKYLITVNLEQNLSKKLKIHKNELIDVYYKFYERIFSLFVVKSIKSLIVDEIANFILEIKKI